MELIPLLTADNKMAKANAEALLKEYGVPFTKAGELMAVGEKLVVTDENDAEGMAKAREIRLELRQERIAIEKRHGELKADINARGNAIDLVKRTAVEQIKPIEEHLALQEKFAEAKQAERKAKITTERIQKLTAFNTDITMYNVEDMTDEQFETLVSDLQAKADAKIEAEKKAEAERLEAIEAEKKRQAEVEAENARLKAEADKRAEEDRIAEQNRQAEYNRLSKIKVELLDLAHNLKTVEDCDKAEDKLDEFYEAMVETDKSNEIVESAYSKSKAEIKELRTFIREQAVKKAEDDRIAKEAEEKRIAEEAERTAMLAPDKDKLMQFADQMQKVEMPVMKTKEGQAVVTEIEGIFQRLNKFITNKASEL